MSDKTGLSREIIKWLQELELSSYPKNLRRDLCNGYLVAEIFSHYFPQDFYIHSYHKGLSLSTKQQNWSWIQKVLQKKNLQLRKETVDGTIHCEPGAAELLVKDIYTALMTQSDTDVWRRRSQPTSLACSTASRAIKNNRAGTEITAEPDTCRNQRGSQIIVRRHLEPSATERSLIPDSSALRGDSISYKEIKVNQPVGWLQLNP